RGWWRCRGRPGGSLVDRLRALHGRVPELVEVAVGEPHAAGRALVVLVERTRQAGEPGVVGDLRVAGPVAEGDEVAGAVDPQLERGVAQAVEVEVDAAARLGAEPQRLVRAPDLQPFEAPAQLLGERPVLVPPERGEERLP